MIEGEVKEGTSKDGAWSHQDWMSYDELWLEPDRSEHQRDEFLVNLWLNVRYETEGDTLMLKSNAKLPKSETRFVELTCWSMSKAAYNVQSQQSKNSSHFTVLPGFGMYDLSLQHFMGSPCVRTTDAPS